MSHFLNNWRTSLTPASSPIEPKASLEAFTQPSATQFNIPREIMEEGSLWAEIPRQATAEVLTSRSAGLIPKETPTMIPAETETECSPCPAQIAEPANSTVNITAITEPTREVAKMPTTEAEPVDGHDNDNNGKTRSSAAPKHGDLTFAVRIDQLRLAHETELAFWKDKAERLEATLAERDRFQNKVKLPAQKIRWTVEVITWAMSQIAKRTCQPLVIGIDDNDDQILGWLPGYWSEADATLAIEKMRKELLEVVDKELLLPTPLEIQSWDKMEKALTMAYEWKTTKGFWESLLEDLPFDAMKFKFERPQQEHDLWEGEVEEGSPMPKSRKRMPQQQVATAPAGPRARKPVLQHNSGTRSAVQLLERLYDTLEDRTICDTGNGKINLDTLNFGNKRLMIDDTTAKQKLDELLRQAAESGLDERRVASCRIHDAVRDLLDTWAVVPSAEGTPEPTRSPRPAETQIKKRGKHGVLNAQTARLIHGRRARIARGDLKLIIVPKRKEIEATKSSILAKYFDKYNVTVPEMAQKLETGDKENYAKLCTTMHGTGCHVMVGCDVKSCVECARTTQFIQLDFALRPTEVRLYLAPGNGLDGNGNPTNSNGSQVCPDDSLNMAWMPIEGEDVWKLGGQFTRGRFQLGDGDMTTTMSASFGALPVSKQAPVIAEHSKAARSNENIRARKRLNTSKAKLRLLDLKRRRHQGASLGAMKYDRLKETAQTDNQLRHRQRQKEFQYKRLRSAYDLEGEEMENLARMVDGILAKVDEAGLAFDAGCDWIVGEDVREWAAKRTISGIVEDMGGDERGGASGAGKDDRKAGSQSNPAANLDSAAATQNTKNTDNNPAGTGAVDKRSSGDNTCRRNPGHDEPNEPVNKKRKTLHTTGGRGPLCRGLEGVGEIHRRRNQDDGKGHAGGWAY